MKPLLKAPVQRPTFGTPDSIAPHRLVMLPPAMQAEGLRLLFEMGQTMREVQERTGLGAGSIRHLIANTRPYRIDEGETGHA